ncbi:MAG: phosphoribosylamine--glycine ligase [Actinomycetota bacterium]|nr:phosphoribosylamine--glycine ligase [Actinomycetota bacterium]
MRTLLLGSGGRENALAWALERSNVVSELIAAPGNPGVARFAALAEVELEDPSSVQSLAGRVDPELVVIGPEAPLVAGTADVLRAKGMKVFGPDASAALIEGSKSFAKAVMAEAGIAAGKARAFTNVDDAVSFMDELGPPFVIKADGLAAGKGVVVTEDRSAAVDALEDRLVRGLFGDAGRKVVVEEFLRGEEVSIIGVSDGRTILTCEPAQDYKRALDGDNGPNTGGMGSYSPVPACPPGAVEEISEEVLNPIVDVLSNAGSPFVGALYAGLVLTDSGPRVMEFNARWGDPETQALLPRLCSDFGEICAACAGGELAGAELRWRREACVSVVLASAGYPGPYVGGMDILGVEDAAEVAGVEVFQAGTALRDGQLISAGGRVLSVSALGDGFEQARERAYDAASRIHFHGRQMRSDIGLRAVESESLSRSMSAHPASADRRGASE